MVLIDHPQQQDAPQDVAPSAEVQKGGRHAATPPATTSRFKRRHRWPILTPVAALGVLGVAPPAGRLRTAVPEVPYKSQLPSGHQPAPKISFLPSGPPTGSIVL